MVRRTTQVIAVASTATALFATAARASATAIGSEGFTVPPFKCFGSTAVLKFDMTVAQSDLSGVTFNPETETLFAINNGDRKVYEITYPNTLVQSWDLSSVSLDLEGISSMGNRKFAITDENPATVYTVTLNSNGTFSNSKTVLADVNTVNAGANLGFEGVAWLSTPDKFIIVQEQNPSKLWSLPVQGTVFTGVTGDLAADAKQIKSIGGLTRGGDSMDEVFLVVKLYNSTGRANEVYNQKAIWRYNLTSNTFTERFGGEVCDMGQPEGLTFWKNSTTGNIMMLIVGETYEARVYEALSNCTDALGAIETTTMATCAKVEVSSAACEKTLADGGCGWTRCDKTLTTHTKICVKGGNECTLQQCFNHCNSSSFSGKNAGSTCTHWAYDTAESECYIFAGCNNEQWDEDYTQYAMQDPTCERTVEAYPLGCEKRRCDKTISTHNKICVKGGNECTLAQCKAKCQSHTGFTCTTYAYDVVDQECYLFQTCEGEQYDADYSTYVLIDPTCEKNVTAGGCNQRRCDKELTPHEKVCVDPNSRCTKPQCEYKCANKTFTGGQDLYCTHWAWDAVDEECYVFHGCVGEKYDDDYVLITQNYGERLALLAGPSPLAPPPPTVSPSPPPPKSAASFTSIFISIVVVAIATHLAF